jgi:hypothetical protein
MPDGKQYTPFSKPYAGGEFSEKLAVLDDRFQRHVRDFDKLSNIIEELSEKVDAIKINVALIVDQRDTAKDRLSKWKTAGLSILTSLAIGLIIWLGHIAMVVQSAHLPAVGN